MHRSYYFLLLHLLITSSLIKSSSSSSSTTSTSYINLSHQYHRAPVPKKTTLQKHINADSDSDTTLHIDISSTSLTDDDLPNLASTISSLESNGMTCHIDLLMSQNELSLEGLSSFFSTLGEKKTSSSVRLNSLDVSFNDFSNEKDRFLSSIITGKCCPETMALSHVGFGPTHCRVIDKALRHRTNNKQRNVLQHLDLSGNSAIGDVGLSILAPSLSSLSTLDLSSCGITDDGVSSLTNLPTDTLNLSLNNLGNDGVRHLTRLLLSQSSPAAPRRLDLSGNKHVGDDGASALAAVLSSAKQQQQQLEELSLRCTSLAAEGAEALGKTLLAARHLSSLDISGNALGVAAAPAKKASLTRRGVTNVSRSAEKYVSFLNNKLKGVWGYSSSSTSTLESDDEMEEDVPQWKEGVVESEGEARVGATRPKCGGKAFAEGIMAGLSSSSSSSVVEEGRRVISVGLRRCGLDKRAVEALAAAVLECRERGVTLKIDVSLNAGLDDRVVAALNSGAAEEDDDENRLLEELAEVYREEVKVWEAARRRAVEASERARAEARLNAARWEEEQDEYDDYDDEEDEDYDDNNGDDYDKGYDEEEYGYDEY